MMYPVGDFPWPGMIQPYKAPTWPQTYTVPQVEYSITFQTSSGQVTVSGPTSDEALRLARLAGFPSGVEIGSAS